MREPQVCGVVRARPVGCARGPRAEDAVAPGLQGQAEGWGWGLRVEG